MMMYLSALPRVWPSSRNSKEAAVGVEPGSYNMELIRFDLSPKRRVDETYQEQLVFIQLNIVDGLLTVLRRLRVLHDAVFHVLVRHIFLGT